MTVDCPNCGDLHDAQACATEGSLCDCCAAVFSGYEERDAALEESA